MVPQSTFERLLIVGSVLILGALLAFGAITATRTAQMDVSRSNDLVFDSSRAMNSVDAIRLVAKQATLYDPTLTENDFEMRVAVVRSRLKDFDKRAQSFTDDAQVQKHIRKLSEILKRIDVIMDRANCDIVCRGTALLSEARLAKRELVKLQGRGLIVDGKMRREVDALNASIIRKIFAGCLAFMVFAGMVIMVVALKNRELQRQKNQLTESQKRLIEVGLYRAQFLAGMSHEFRTPLNAIKGFAQLILMLKGDMPREKLLEYMTDIEKSAIDLEETTNSVLDLSKIDAGTLDLYEKTVDLIAIMRDVKKQFGIGKGGSRIILRAPDSLSVFCDPTTIKRCVQNLVSNALKFSSEDKKVTIVVRQTATDIMIRVSDQGSGIPASDLKTVWHIYSRSSYTRHSDRQGSGLGLPIVKALIHEHGGDAKLESQIGVGTVVTLTLPISRLRSDTEKAVIAQAA